MYSHTFPDGKTIQLSKSEIQIWKSQEAEEKLKEYEGHKYNRGGLTTYEKIQLGRCLDNIINILEYGSIKIWFNQ